MSSRFARVYGSPGEAPRVLGLLRAFWPLLLVCFAAGYLVRAWFPFPELSVSQVGVLFVLAAATTAVLLAWGDRRLGNFLKGAKGEEWVAHELAFLGPEYAVFNGLRFRGGKQNFDHIIIGPAGIFVVDYLEEAGCTGIPVHSILCFLETELPEEVININGVVVCSGRRLIDVLQETFDKPVPEAHREQVVQELVAVIGDKG